ncbi:uncharacterized protein LOC105839802 [Monomorium pharaonis]|uniref:uncharacterized protein LOC105839802 n=1 Tax=Monomorium pharaonis TaxID=307658 RepID=UPI00063F1F2A|nr:uncharacterized protein LOC105839802 [Monomorium pharaonis]
MKAFLNIFLIILVIATIVISFGTCKPSATTKHTIEYTTEEARSASIGSTVLKSHHRNIIRVRSRNVKLGCPLGEKQDLRGVCRKVL